VHKLCVAMALASSELGHNRPEHSEHFLSRAISARCRSPCLGSSSTRQAQRLNAQRSHSCNAFQVRETATAHKSGECCSYRQAARG